LKAPYYVICVLCHEPLFSMTNNVSNDIHAQKEPD